MKIILRTLFFLLVSHHLSAQKLDHRQGEFIVWLENTNARSQTQLDESLTYFEGKRTDLERKAITSTLPLHRVMVDYTRINERSFLAYLRQHPAIRYAQYNHILEPRKSPNDAFFDRQYQWLNLGTIGSSNADIRATEAWELGTGGITKDGQEIVVALLELGIQSDHPDLVDNIWFNENEIEGNGIDDDNNGYIDDYKGWNVVEQNDNIEHERFDNHGTATFGMIGATGNNSIGVTGVNWNVKVMNVTIDGSLEEASVIEAYDYVLNQRKLYNESNGAEGALVVSTNLSYGSTFIKPEDAPIWCDFYNALGEQGILNCGATDNNDINIDEVGDMPTSCSSDFLITVSSSDVDNKKEELAAFGKNDVDLLAPGEEVWTTDLDSSYTIESGTSYASPTVAGAIGLYWSVASQSRLNAYRINPAQGALLTKEVILSTVDAVEGAEELFRSGGKLNLFETVLNAQCDLPVEDVRLSISPSQVSLLWDAIDTSQYIVEYRKLNEKVWQMSDTLQDGLFSIDVEPCEDYAYRIITLCVNGSFISTDIQYFSSLPERVEISVISSTDTSILVEVDSFFGISNFEVLVNGDSNAVVERLEGQQFLISNLLPDSSYVLQYLYTCSRTLDKNRRDEIIVVTTEKASCGSSVYCDVGTNADSIWIESFSISCIDNPSGNDGGYGYFDFNDCVLDRGESFIFEADMMTNADSLIYFIAIWIDTDKDGFYTNEECIYTSDSLEVGAVLIDTVTIPFDAMGGDTRIRIIADTSIAGVKDPCITQGPGEVEDYCVYINENCPKIPVALDSLAVTETDIFLIWSNVPMNLAYIYRFREAGTNEWDTVLHCNDTLMLENLNNCTTYEIQIMSICHFDTSSFSESLEIETLCSDGRRIVSEVVPVSEVYPNPFRDHINIRMTELHELNWYIIDMQGRIVNQGELNAFDSQLQNLDQMTSGIYHLVLHGPDFPRQVHRMMKL